MNQNYGSFRSFTHLASAAATQRCESLGYSFSAPSNSQMHTGQATTLLLRGQNLLHGTNLWSSGYPPHLSEYGFPVPYNPTYNRNSLSKMVSNVISSEARSFQFAPVTPEKNVLNESAQNNQSPSKLIDFCNERVNQEKKHDGSHQYMGSLSQIAPVTPEKNVERAWDNQSSLKLIDFGVDERVNQEKKQDGSLESGVSLCNEVTSICCDGGLSQSSAIHSFQLQEIPKSNKGEIHAIDLNKTPQQKPKKKKHRPKVIREKKATRTPKTVTPKQAGANESTSRKKRSSGKQSTKESTTPPADVEESVNLAARTHGPSCKRTLNFESVAQTRYECLGTSENCQTVLDNKADGPGTNPRDGEGPEVENPSVGHSFDLNHSMTQLSDTSLPLLENQSLSSPLKRKTPSRENLKILARKRNNMGTTTVSIDDQANGNAAIGNYIPPEEMWPASISLNTNCDNYEAMQSCLNRVAKSHLEPKVSSVKLLPHTEPGAKESNREYGRTTYNNIFHHLNLIGAHFYPMQTCLQMVQGYNQYPGVGYNHGPQYPQIYRNAIAKKPKNGSSELAFETSSFTMPVGHNHSAQNFPKENQASVGFHQPKAYENMLTLRQVEQKTTKRSKAATRLRNLASISAPACNQILAAHTKTAMGYDGQQENGFLHRSQHYMEALVAKDQAKMVTKNHARKGSNNVNSMPFSPTNQVQARKDEIVIFDDRQSSVGSTCAPAGQKFIYSNSSPHRKFQIQNSHILSANFIPDCRSSSNLHETDRMVSFAESIDDIVQRLKDLNIHGEGEIVVNQPQNALVPYVGHGKMVPYEGPFDPAKKRRPRPKVNLDMETLRQWKLLMGKDSSETLEGTDEEKEKWWEEERRVFCGRADSFIARMHLVQGDRRFSQWKGSVVDSVVGVFLTQNVSDHLSSSAFMSLAARFPLPSKTNSRAPNTVGRNISPQEQDVSVLDFNETTKWQDALPVKQISDQSSVTHHEVEHGEEKEIASSTESFGSNTTNGKVHCLQDTHLAICETGQVMFRESAENQVDIPVTVTATNGANLVEPEDRRCQEDISYSAVSSQNSTDSTIQTADRIGSSSESNSEAEERMTTCRCSCLDSSTSFMELLHMAGSNIFPELRINGNNVSSKGNFMGASEKANISKHQINPDQTMEPRASPEKEPETCNSQPMESTRTSSANTLHVYSDLRVENTTTFRSQAGEIDCGEENTNVVENGIHIDVLAQNQSYVMHQTNSSLQNYEGETSNPAGCLRLTDNMVPMDGKVVELSSRDEVCSSDQTTVVKTNDILKAKRPRTIPQNRNVFDWENLRKQVTGNGAPKERSQETLDTLDWEAIRCADVDEVAQTIKERGMNNMLAERIKAFLNRLVNEHGSIDLEWLRDIPPDKAKDYLLSIRGLGLKSVECVRLLALQHLAFPVDTNVGRICVRLGWVPLQPLPESLQLHLLELYPVLESIQKYLWPRLCKLDQRTLYELHYQLITFGKVFCTKSRPNCNACPMRGECKHFASAFASARFALPGPDEKSLVSSVAPIMGAHDHKLVINPMPLAPLPPLEGNSQTQADCSVNKCQPIMVHEQKPLCEPIIEEPATPEPEYVESSESAIEDTLYEDPDEIPTIKLNLEELTLHVQNYIQENRLDVQAADMSKALVTSDVASIPMPKLKNVSRLRTEHQVYELPDTHPLLEGLDPREPDDPCSYLLAIWTPGETAESIEPPKVCCSSQASCGLCDMETCFGCNSIREANSQTVRGTLLIPCRTAMRGSFPLNGTYFQVNEVFADHDSSINPIDVPRAWIWNLPRRTVFFGTSIPTIFRGLTTEGIQYCFWRGMKPTIFGQFSIVLVDYHKFK